ncbi:MAG TPA: manganese efflux pump MntP family protein [Candidatus Cryosericum sp.]|nr:manganese efflux pump MntP family protein [Candidatus Cryosericum sp.]
MEFWTVLVIAVGLSMDAFAISVAGGCSIQHMTVRRALKSGWWFGGFQMLMPILGWLGGLALRGLVQNVSHWVAFALLGLIGVKMIVEGVRDPPAGECAQSEDHGWQEMLVLAIATSIDAFAVGVSLSILRVSIWWPATLIGVVTFSLSVAGTLLGCRVGGLLQDKAEVVGGVALVAIGLRILLEGLL